MPTSQDKRSENEVMYAELQGKTKAEWRQLTKKKQENILTLYFVKKMQGTQILFNRSYPEGDIGELLSKYLTDLVGSADVTFHSSTAQTARRTADRLKELLNDPERFSKLDFGVDVAERDAGLLRYFISTKSFARADEGSACVIIGPKGSGKTAILKALQAKHGVNNSIVITPEIFATSMLRQIVEGNKDLCDEEQAFVSTWIFTILVEVFKRVAADPSVTLLRPI